MQPAAEEVEPTFLGFGAFETTAFCTAILVACYSLISNPKGRQSARDHSEYEVYAGWRLAVLTLAAQAALMVAVVTTLVNQRVHSTPVLWVAALMLAPWAPLAGRVYQTLSSAPRVRRMMRQRVTRNELAAVVRDRFKFGQRGIALPVLGYHAGVALPPNPILALRANPRLAPHEPALRRHADAAAQTDASRGRALELGSLWMMNQSRQPAAIPRRIFLSSRVVGALDPLARAWTVRGLTLRADPMPGLAPLRARARVLDIADRLQQGGTIADDLMARAMGPRYCDRCRLATRAAVEAFLESSERGHTDLRARLWLRHVGADWRGRFEPVVDLMWEACFMDARAEKVEYDDDDASPSYGDRTKVTTVKTLVLLWLIARSVCHADVEYDGYRDVAAVVREGPFARAWWDRFWRELADMMSDTECVSASQVDAGTPSKFKATLRKLIDDDMREIVDILVRTPMQDGLCGEDKCRLFDGQITLQTYR